MSNFWAGVVEGMLFGFLVCGLIAMVVWTVTEVCR